MLKTKYITVILSVYIFLMLYPTQVKAQILNQTPYIWYNFENNLNDLQGNSTLTLIPDPPGDGLNRENTSRTFGSNTFGKYWKWTSAKARGGGFSVLANKDLGEEYTIYLRFSFEDVGEISNLWKKIIDFKNKQSDTGFYFYGNGRIQFFSGGFGSKYTKNGELLVLVCTRDSSGTFKVYIANETDYSLTLDYTVSTGVNSIFDTSLGGSLMGFFFDDDVTASEATSGGKVYEIRVWDKLLIKSEIEDIINKGEIIVKYLDADGNDISQSERLTGEDGDPYNTQPKYLNNCVLTNTPSNATGTFEKGKSFEVIYTYDCYASINPALRSMPE